MFFSLSALLSSALKRHRLTKKISSLELQKKLSFILGDALPKHARVIKLQNKTLFIKTKSAAYAGELKLRETRIIRKLRENGFAVQKVTSIL